MAGGPFKGHFKTPSNAKPLAPQRTAGAKTPRLNKVKNPRKKDVFILCRFFI